MRRSSRLIIFEGPDGAGKTHAAKRLADELGARYVHLGPFPHVRQTLARLYAETLLPAVLGLQDVVLDRSWLSERPYGLAYRNGADRLGVENVRALERLALRCRAGVVLALPPYATVEAHWCSRRAVELLETPAQLAQVHDYYDRHLATSLPVFRYDYTRGDPFRVDDMLLTRPHEADSPSAGSLDGDFLVVGDEFANHQDADTFYQWPFGALGGGGCSRWLARQLEAAGVGEDRLCWANADVGGGFLARLYFDLTRSGGKTVVALGHKAHERLETWGFPHLRCPHPQHAKRFDYREPYRLIEILKGAATDV